MDYTINKISIENFKSYATTQSISVSDLSVFLGANSSGKSTAIQTLLAIKQTMECNSKEIDLLLSGQYVALGEFKDVIYDKEKNEFNLGIDFKCVNNNETMDSKDSYAIKWYFKNADEKYQAQLSKIVISYEDKSVSFVRKQLNKYQMVVGDYDTPIFTRISNLKISDKLYLKYDTTFNKLFADYINDIKELIEGKKYHKIATNELVSPRVSTDFFVPILSNYSKIDIEQDREKDHEAEEVADLLLGLLEEFSLYQNPLGCDYLGFANEVKKYSMFMIVKSVGKNDELMNIYHKHNAIIKEYRDNTEIDISKFKGEEPMSRYMILRTNRDNNNDYIDAYQWVGSFYDVFEKVITNLLFVGPIRENPKGLYNIGFEQVPKYVGPTGSNFASVLLHENKEKDYILPYGEVGKMLLWDAVNEWASHLNIASAVAVTHATSFGITVSVSDTQNKTADIMNVGIGTSQVLPVLITGLLSEVDETLVFEQPELHLHPFSQSRLADFFVELIKHGRKIIIETHSEAFMLRLRYHMLKGNCDKDAVSINFFQNKQGTKVSKCCISGYGNIEYPDDFRDETQELLNDLVKAALKRNSE